MRLYDKIAPDLGKRDRDELECAGLIPRQIDDVVAKLRVTMQNGVSVQDVLEAVRSSE